LVLLELGLVLSIQSVYDKNGNQFNSFNLRKLIERFKQKYENCPVLTQAVSLMLEEDETIRPDFVELAKSLPDYKEVEAYYMKVSARSQKNSKLSGKTQGSSDQITGNLRAENEAAGNQNAQRVMEKLESRDLAHIKGPEPVVARNLPGNNELDVNRGKTDPPKLSSFLSDIGKADNFEPQKTTDGIPYDQLFDPTSKNLFGSQPDESAKVISVRKYNEKILEKNRNKNNMLHKVNDHDKYMMNNFQQPKYVFH
jgi:hypothetical protein